LTYPDKAAIAEREKQWMAADLIKPAL